MAVIVLPSTLMNGTVGDADQVQGDFAAILAQVNGNVDEDNLADGGVITPKILDGAVTTPKLGNGAVTNAKVDNNAAIAYSKLAALATGQLVAGNAGVATARTLAGLATIDSAGKLIGNVASSPQGLDVNIANNGTSWTSLIASDTPDAGLYLVWVRARINLGTGSGMDMAEVRLWRSSDSAVLDTDVVNLASGSFDECSLKMFALVTLAAGEDLNVDARSGALSGTIVAKGAGGELVKWRVG